MRKIFVDQLSEDDFLELEIKLGEANNFIAELLETLYFIHTQKDVKLYFHKSIKFYSENLQGLHIDVLRLFRTIIKQGQPLEIIKENNVEYYIVGHGVLEKANDILSQLVDNQIDYADSCMLFVPIKQKYMQPLFVIRDRNTKDREVNMVRVICCDTIQEVKNWIDRKRVFEHHSKHDLKKRTNNKNEKVSVLYRDPIREKEIIETLLNSAVASDNSSSKVLYNYDHGHQKYIKFYAHRENMELYHAFHVEKEDEHDIPNKIKQELKKIKPLSL